MKQYAVTGMACAACSARVEKAVSRVEGVSSCSVNLLTNSMGVEGDVPDSVIIQAVVDAGYGAHVMEQKKNGETETEDTLKDTETKKLRKRLIASLILLVFLMYLSMGHMMWGWPLPGVLGVNHVAMGLAQMLLTIAIMVINQRFFVSGYKSLWRRSPNMDTLVALGASAAFGYSVYALFAMAEAQRLMDEAKVMAYMHEFYFESAAMILTLITVGKMLEARSRGKTTDAIKGLMKLAPRTAVVVRDGKEISVPVKEVQKGEMFLVKPGENIPVDGVILEGSSAVNEAALTGESIPVDKKEGEMVSAATLNQTGFLRCEAIRVGEDTTLSQIIQMVKDAAATKAPIAKIADRVSGVFVPVVISIAVVTFLVWFLCGQSVGYALARAISVLVISCPCALGLATPVAIMVGNGLGARHGILFKTAAALEETGKIATVALDKTGTITRGEPKVTDMIPFSGYSENELLSYAYALEKKSEHPLARAIVSYAEELDTLAPELSEFEIMPGNGLKGQIKENGKTEVLLGGNQSAIEKVTVIDDTVKGQANRLAEEGKTPLYFAKDDTLLGMIAVADTMKEDSADAVSQMQKMGLRVVMLTGDNEKTANAIGREAGVDEVIAGVLPDEKEAVIRKLKENGKVAMVGDGINDAPALRAADIGISVYGAVDIAREAADIILLEKSLMVLEEGVIEGRRTFANMLKYIKMTASSNFGNVFSVLVASAFLPFLPMLPLHLLIQNLLYDVSQVAIPFDNVDDEQIQKPQRWNPADLGRFMIFFGPISSIFDILTFCLMWWVFHANTPETQTLFQSGWFVVGLLSQTLIVHMIRTRRVPFIQSCASWPLMIMTVIVMIVGIALPFSPLASYLQLQALPLSYFPWLVAILAGYMTLTQLVKGFYSRRYGWQ